METEKLNEHKKKKKKFLRAFHNRAEFQKKCQVDSNCLL